LNNSFFDSILMDYKNLSVDQDIIAFASSSLTIGRIIHSSTNLTQSSSDIFKEQSQIVPF
jgi:hypothetical protein